MRRGPASDHYRSIPGRNRRGAIGSAGEVLAEAVVATVRPRRTQLTTTGLPFRVRLDPSGVREMKLVS